MTHKGRKCELVKEFSLKDQDGKVIPYILAQVGKTFHYLVYPKDQFEETLDKLNGT